MICCGSIGAGRWRKWLDDPEAVSGTARITPGSIPTSARAAVIGCLSPIGTCSKMAACEPDSQTRNARSAKGHNAKQRRVRS